MKSLLVLSLISIFSTFAVAESYTPGCFNALMRAEKHARANVDLLNKLDGIHIGINLFSDMNAKLADIDVTNKNLLLVNQIEVHDQLESVRSDFARVQPKLSAKDKQNLIKNCGFSQGGSLFGIPIVARPAQ